MFEVVVFLVLVKLLAEHEQKIEMILKTLFLGDMIEQIVFDDDATERVKEGFEFAKSASFSLPYASDLRIAASA